MNVNFFKVLPFLKKIQVLPNTSMSIILRVTHQLLTHQRGRRKSHKPITQGNFLDLEISEHAVIQNSTYLF